jgi:hypothetical protein
MPQILQLRVDDSTMEAIAELGKRQYPSSLADRHGEALGYDRLAVLNDILSAGLAALTGDAAVPPTPIAKRSASATTTPPDDATWMARIEALEAEVSRLSQAVESISGNSPTSSAKTPPAVPAVPAVPPKTVTSRATTTKVAPSATRPKSTTPAPQAVTPTRTTPAATPKPIVKPATPVVKPAAKSAKATVAASPTPSSSVKRAKTPSRRRRSSSQMNPDEVKKLQDAPSLSKNGLASLCRCDKRTLDRKREEGELGKFTRARCGVEYSYKESDTRYYKVP